jgi:hypothetical protein
VVLSSDSHADETRRREVRGGSADTVPALSSSAVYGLGLFKEAGLEPNRKQGPAESRIMMVRENGRFSVGRGGRI